MEDKIRDDIMATDEMGRNCLQARHICCYRSSPHLTSLAKSLACVGLSKEVSVRVKVRPVIATLVEKLRKNP